MSTIGMRSITLSDYAKRLGPDKQIVKVMEVMEQSNEVLNDAMFLEANNVTTHRTIIRTGLPEEYWRSLNLRVPTTKNRTVQIDDRIGMLETWSVVDCGMADLNRFQTDFLLSEERPYLKTLNDHITKTIFYGDRSSNSAFEGLSSRYSTLDVNKAESASNVIDAGGTGDNLTSAWLCVWGDLTLHMIYPKGTTLGLRREYLGRCPIVDDDGKEFMGYKTNYSWSLGLCLRDWRYVVRIANIAPDTDFESLFLSMIRACNRIPNIRLGRAVWYMGSELKSVLDCVASTRSQALITMGNFAGEAATCFKAIPIRLVDMLEQNESPVK